MIKNDFLKFQWVVFCFLAIVLTRGTYVYITSTNFINVPIVLNQNQKIELPIFRVFPHHLVAALEFEKHSGKSRPELGSSKARTYSKELGYIEFENPGEPIKISAQLKEKQIIYEAMPAITDHPKCSRSLVPFIEDGCHNRIPWQSGKFLDIPSGDSKIVFTVIEVGSKIQGETAALVVRPPMNFTTIAENYSRLYMLFCIWPVYAIFLCFYFIILIRRSFYKKSPYT